ncbi:MAG TPA: hypothetical protein VD860_01855 [Azospirillum sp.]|nr:hypothetical protein [Azospirillum sp.]
MPDIDDIWDDDEDRQHCAGHGERRPAAARAVQQPSAVREALEAWIAADKADDDARELCERADGEGWSDDPTGSSHITAAFTRANEAWRRARELRDAALSSAGEQGWRPIETGPTSLPGSMTCVIVAYENERGRRFSRQAWYMLHYPLSVDDVEVMADCGPYDSDEGVRYVTGFFEECDHADYDEAYRPFSMKLLGWRPMPAPPASTKGER